MHVSQVQRAQEELDILAAERERCLAYLERRQAEIEAALDRCGARSAALRSSSIEVPQCHSLWAREPAAHSASERGLELRYCEGLHLLLSDALLTSTKQMLAARVAFAGGDAAACNVDEYECFDEEEEVL